MSNVEIFKRTFSMVVGDDKTVNFWKDAWGRTIFFMVRFPWLGTPSNHSDGLVADLRLAGDNIWGRICSLGGSDGRTRQLN